LSDEQRCTCIAVYFADVLGAPEEADWGGHGGTTSIIQRELAVPDGPRDMMKQIPTDVAESLERRGVLSREEGWFWRGKQTLGSEFVHATVWPLVQGSIEETPPFIRHRC